MHLRAFQVVPVIKNSPAKAGDAGDAGSVPGRSPGEANGTYCSILAWKSHGQRILAGNSQRIGHNWAYTCMRTCTHSHTHTCAHTCAHAHTHTHTHTRTVHSQPQLHHSLCVCLWESDFTSLYLNLSLCKITVKVLCILVNVQKS